MESSAREACPLSCSSSDFPVYWLCPGRHSISMWSLLDWCLVMTESKLFGLFHLQGTAKWANMNFYHWKGKRELQKLEIHCLLPQRWEVKIAIFPTSFSICVLLGQWAQYFNMNCLKLTASVHISKCVHISPLEHWLIHQFLKSFCKLNVYDAEDWAQHVKNMGGHIK